MTSSYSLYSPGAQIFANLHVLPMSWKALLGLPIQDERAALASVLYLCLPWSAFLYPRHLLRSRPHLSPACACQWGKTAPALGA